METKERELVLLKEMLSNRERILEKHDEHVNATEIFVSKEREHIEALEKTLKQREVAFSKKEDYEQFFITHQLLKQELIEE